MIRIGAFSQMKITYLIGGYDVSKQVFYHVTCRNNVLRGVNNNELIFKLGYEDFKDRGVR